MAQTITLYAKLIECLWNKEVAVTDSFKVVLLTSAYTPNQDTHKYYSDLTGEVVGGGATGIGYTTGGLALTNFTMTYNASTNLYTFDVNDITIANSTITARYAVIIDSTPTNKPLVLCCDFGVDKTSTTGNFSINWNASGLFTQKVPDPLVV